MPIFAIFILFPLAEIIVFVAVSSKIGLLTAFILSLFTAILGGSLVKYQGLQTMLSAHKTFLRGELPSRELFDGLCIVAAGALLITPGFISDTFGFALLIPQIRQMILEKAIQSGKFKVTGFNAEFTEFHDIKSKTRPNDPEIIEAEFIEAEYERTDEDKK